MSKQIVIADSTQIAAFLQCERLWNYEHRQRLVPLEAGTSDAISMGSYGHKLLEIYYNSIIDGKGAEHGINAARAFDIDNFICTCSHSIDYHRELISPTSIPQECECNAQSCNCELFEPVRFPLDAVDRQTVLNRFEEYCYIQAARSNIIHPAHTEVGFSELLYEDADRMYILEGRIDLIGTYGSNGNEQQVIVDHKFQLKEKRLYKKMIQFRNYAMVAKANLMLLNMIRLAKGVTPRTFETIPISFTDVEHQWWRRELISIYDRMAEILPSQFMDVEEREPLPNWSSCSGMYGYECNYTRLCEPTEQEPTLLEAKKQALYKIKPVWSPW